MIAMNPYLQFMGNAEQAMNFYKTVFGGEFTIATRYNELPGGEKMLSEEGSKFIELGVF